MRYLTYLLLLVSVAMGQTVSALEATPKIWDLAAAWLVLQELGCPIRWLVRDPGALQPGEDLAQADREIIIQMVMKIHRGIKHLMCVYL